MTMSKRLLSAVALATLAAGCATTREAVFTTTELPEADYDRAWQAVVSAADKYFDIIDQDKDDGLVVTGFKTDDELSILDLPLGILDRDRLYTSRRRVVARLGRVAGGLELKLMVEKQRQEYAAGHEFVSDEYDPASSMRLTGFRASEEEIPSRWVPSGNDRSLERRLISEIFAGIESLPEPGE